MLRLIVSLLKARPTQAQLEQAGQAQLPMRSVQVKPHTRQGKPVKGHQRRVRKREPISPKHQRPTAADIAHIIPPDRLAHFEAETPDDKSMAYQARVTRQAVAEKGWPDEYAWAVWDLATMMPGTRSFKERLQIAINQREAALVQDPGWVDLNRSWDDLHGHRTNDVARIYEDIGKWEDKHREAPAEHMMIIFGPDAQEFSGRHFYFTPQDTLKQYPGVDTTRQCAVGTRAKNLAKLTGRAIMTHNHPTGGPLSTPDLVLASVLNFAEIRATTPNGGTWVTRRPEGGWPNALDLNIMLAGINNDALDNAREKMDMHILKAGGDPDDAEASPHFDKHLWRRLVATEYFKALPALSDIGIEVEYRPPDARPHDVSARRVPDVQELEVILTKAAEILDHDLEKGEQLGLGLNVPVKAHTRRTKKGPVQVRAHTRKPRAIPYEQEQEIRQKIRLSMPLTDEEQAIIDERDAYRVAQSERMKAARDTLRANNCTQRHGWYVHPITENNKGSETIVRPSEWLGIAAYHPDGQVRVRGDDKGRLHLEHRADGHGGEWVTVGAFPRRNPKIQRDAGILAKKIRQKYGTLEMLNQDKAAEERLAEEEDLGAKHPGAWDTSPGHSWSKTRESAKGKLTWLGVSNIRTSKKVQRLKDGQVRADVEIRRPDGILLGRATYVDDSTHPEYADGAALWQMPHGAHIRLPEGWQPEDSDRHLSNRDWYLSWGAADRRHQRGHQELGEKVLLRPTQTLDGYGVHVDHSLMVERLDTPDRVEELAARQALDLAAQDAFERLSGWGEEIEPEPWPTPPARRGFYSHDELSHNLSAVRDRPEVKAMWREVRQAERKVRRMIGDTMFKRAMHPPGYTHEKPWPDPTYAVSQWVHRQFTDYEHPPKAWSPSTAELNAHRSEWATPEALEQRWTEWWSGYEERTRAFLDFVETAETWDRHTSPAKLVAAVEGHPAHYEVRDVVKAILEDRGYRFGRRSGELPSASEALSTSSGWARYRQAYQKVATQDRPALTLESPTGKVKTGTPEAAEHYENLVREVQMLGKEPHKKLVEKGWSGTWFTLDPVTKEQRRSFSTRRDARAYMKEQLPKMMKEAAEKAGSAAVAKTKAVVRR